MAAKLKVDELESVDGSTNLILNNSVTMATNKTLPAASLTGTVAANTVDSDSYVDGSIDAAHLSANSVDSASYVDGSIDEVHLSDNSVDSRAYVDGSIDNEHIADNALDSEHYAAGSIDLEHMSSESVDEDNLHISNAGSNGEFLSKQSGNAGGLTWASVTTDLVGDTTPQLGGFLDANGNYMQTEKGADIASASPIVITTVGDYFDVTGTTNFAAMTVAADRQFTLQFDGVLTMTHHATNLDLPGEANITTAAGDVAVFQSTAANQVQCISYTRASGEPIVGGGKVLQVVSHFINTAIALNSSSYSSVISKAITPAKAGSTFVIFTTLDAITKDATSNYIRGKISRSGTGVSGGASFINSEKLYDHHGYYGMISSAFDLGTLTNVSHDNPSYTLGNTITYGVDARRFDGSGTITINKWGSGTTFIIIMEIGA